MTPRKQLWAPSPERARASQMFTFMQQVSRRFGVAADWEALRAWSIRESEQFWRALLEFACVEPTQPASATRSGSGMLDTRWFPGMHLNYARHLLRASGPSDAIIAHTETGPARRISRDQLRRQVARCAAALRADGVKRGDRVAAFMPNLPETIIAMLAAASIGAIWSSCSPDFGAGGVLDRFGQIQPVVLLACDGYSYGGKTIDLVERICELRQKLPSVRRVLIVPRAGADPTGRQPGADSEPLAALRDQPGVIAWDHYLAAQPADTPLIFDEVPFDHPLFIMYSSGTTGVPKCIVHGHGGTLLQHLKEHLLHCDIRENDRVFFFTTCGWMMWNWLASALGSQAAIVLYEGNPAYPSVARLWDLAQRERINVFGASPKFLAACQKAHLEPARSHDLAALRCVLSTGSPLSEELFEWTYQAVKADLQLSSISGGTDIISCFMLGNPLLPVYAGEIQCRGLAMDVQAWDQSGRPLLGQKGELVCTNPFPSQPVGFWNDPQHRKYRAAYFEHFPGVWRHGDFIEITPSGGVVVYGRSDATLNPGGIRIGTAEIYRLVEDLPEVLDSLAVARRVADEDVEIVLFVVLAPGKALDDALQQRIRSAIANGATKRHLPRHIRAVRDIPRTISGKKVELAVTQLLHGEVVLNRDALANPDALDEFREMRFE